MSVCIPTRDRAAFLGETLRSVLRQEDVPLEVVICDDGSRDGTLERVPELSDPRVRVSRSPFPRGVAAARNRCLELARGELIGWLDSDDAYEPGALRTAVDALDAAPGTVLFHAAHHVMDVRGDPLPDWPVLSSREFVECGEDAFAELILENYVAAPTAVVRRDAHDRAGPYDERLRRGEDWHMWARIALCGDVVYSPKRLARYRYHPESLSGEARARDGALRAQLEVIDRWFGEGGVDVADRAARERRAREALAARAIRRAGDAYTRGDREGALAAVDLVERQARGLPADVLRALRDGLRSGADYAVHEAARTLLSELAGRLEGSRFGVRIRTESEPDPTWQVAILEIAEVARRVIPSGEQVAVLDKWDPTLRHHLRRPGRTFPDRRSFPDGYPKTDEEAIAALERLRRDGVTFLVATSATSWWFDHYADFARHVRDRYRLAWRDARCLVYDLS